MAAGLIKQWLAARAPGLRRALHAFDGRTLERIEAALKTQRRQALLQEDNAALLGEALAGIGGADREGRFAWLGPAPYEATGLARFSWECVRAAPIPVDYFCSAREPGRFLGWAGRLAMETEARLYPLSALARGVHSGRYRAILVSLGNSPHNLPVWRAARAIREWAPEARVWLHAHDPLLLDLTWLDVGENRAAFAAALRRAYGAARIEGLCGRRDPGEPDFPRLRAAGVLGARALLAGARFEKILVNSRRAAEIFALDLAGPASAPPIERVFHPLFRAPAWRGPSDGVVRIASFGGAGASKQTETVIAACALVANHGAPIELVLAGYDIDAYLAARRQPRPAWLRAYGHADDEALQALMADCSLAVQLRAEDLGESSGVLAQLVATGTPTIATQMPAFADFAEAFAPAPPAISADMLATLIRAELQRGPRAAGRLSETHSTAAFWRALLEDAG